MASPLKYAPPFPYFGGKSRIASRVWSFLGDTPNYVEPFFGAGAVYFLRPHPHRIATINDADGFVANFWRAMQSDPAAVAKWADHPVFENDLHARHAWLVMRAADLKIRLEGDPDYFDAKIAGWWAWGMSCWIGCGFCSGRGPWRVVNRQRVHLGNAGQGVNRQLVHLGNAGQGVNRQLVHLGDAGQGVNRKRVHLRDYFLQLAAQLSVARVCCGDWQRVCGPSPTLNNGLTAVFLAPPYSRAMRDKGLYRTEVVEVMASPRKESPPHPNPPRKGGGEQPRAD